jgi:hypothetical protein
MSKLIFLWISTIILGLTFSCQNGATDSENDSELNFSQFDYIDKIDVNMSFDGVLSLIPKDKRTISNSDIGFVFAWDRNLVNHELSAFFYGYDSFSELRVILDLAKNQEFSDRVMMYLHKIQENKYGPPYNYINNKDEELAQWKEVRMESEYIISLFYEKTKHLITFECFLLDQEGLDFQNGTEGEWVQRGPDGEWVWMPNE